MTEPVPGFVRMAARAQGMGGLRLIAGGVLAPHWRGFGHALVAHVFTGSTSSCRHRARHETLPGVTYHPGRLMAPGAGGMTLPGFVRAQGLRAVDFLALDDPAVLLALGGWMEVWGVLGVQVPVNCRWPAFAPVDQALCRRGFDLFDLAMRRGTDADGPLGEALYFRDPAGESEAEWLGAARLVRLAAMMASTGHPGEAARLIGRTRRILGDVIDVAGALAQLQAQEAAAIRPAADPALLAADDAWFYPPPATRFLPAGR